MLVGHSLGGHVARLDADTHPSRSRTSSSVRGTTFPDVPIVTEGEHVEAVVDTVEAVLAELDGR